MQVVSGIVTVADFFLDTCEPLSADPRTHKHPDAVCFSLRVGTVSGFSLYCLAIPLVAVRAESGLKHLAVK